MLVSALKNIAATGSSGAISLITIDVDADADKNKVDSAPVIAVGFSAASKVGLPPADTATLGKEGYIVTAAAPIAAGSIAATGGKGAARGTSCSRLIPYAIYLIYIKNLSLQD